MSPLEALLAEIAERLGESLRVEGRMGGASFSSAATLIGASKRRYFLKWSLDGQGDPFEAEAHGLECLRQAPSVRVPEVVAVGSGYLVLELLRHGRPTPETEAALGRAVASVHSVTAENYGLERGNYCGATPQPNGWWDNWVEFFREQRIAHQHRLLAGSGRCPPKLSAGLDRIADELPVLLDGPEEPPRLLHGDLWSGNALTLSGGGVALIDPAVHFGRRESDLAMTELFGGFSRRFYSAYHERWPRDPGYARRRDVYALYHVLNHANLFGGSYVQQAASLVHRILSARS